MTFFKIRNPIQRRTKKSRIISELDCLVHALVVARDGNCCLKCGGTERLAAAHIFSKGPYSRLRFELLNVLTLCYHCHIHWAHKSPHDFVEWIERMWPGREMVLRRMAATAPKLDLKLLRIGLQLEVSQL